MIDKNNSKFRFTNETFVFRDHKKADHEIIKALEKTIKKQNEIIDILNKIINKEC